MPTQAVKGSSPESQEAKTARSLFPGIGARIIIAVCVVLIVCVRRFDAEILAAFPVIDPAIINLITLIAGFVACVSLASWFFSRSGYSSTVRKWSAVALVGLGMVAAATVRLDGFSGDMAPRFAWRWSPRSDTTLLPVEHPVETIGVDLSETAPTDFPQFLGPERSAFVPGPELERDWVAHSPKLLWKQPIGAGWSAFSVVRDYAFTLEQRGPDEWVTCYEVETGKPIWGHSIRARHETTLGGIGPRSTPTVIDGRVYALGATGVLRCLDGATGKVLWMDDVLKRVGVTAGEDLASVAWGRSNSPLVYDNLVVIPAGGKPGKTRSLIAYDKITGKVAWMKGDKQISYASPTLATLGGKRQIIITNEDTVAGHDAETGDELWTFPWPGLSNQNASASQPVVIGDDRVFISKGYGGGAAIYEVTEKNGRWSPRLVWANPRVLRTKFANVALIDGFAYGLSDGILECAAIDSNESKWKKGRYGNGQLLAVGKSLLVVSEKGELIHLEATPEGNRELGRIQAIEGQTWNNLCLSGNRLLVRNGQEAACYELPVVGGQLE